MLCSMSSDGNLRDRKKRRTREALLTCARAWFGTQGYDATTMDEIAEAAEVSRRTLFRYFPTKEALVFHDEEARLARFRETLAAGPGAGSGFTAVRRALMALAGDYVLERETIAIRQCVVDASPTLVAAERVYDQAWEEAIAAALLPADGSPEARRSARLLAGALFDVLRAALREWFATDCDLDLVALGEHALDLLASGFHLDDDDNERHH